MTKLLDWSWHEEHLVWPQQRETSDQIENDTDLTLLVPTQQVLLTEATLPTRNKKNVLHALPYALEDELTEDVEQIHFAMGDWQGDGNRLAVAAVDKSLMESWLQQFNAEGLKPKQLQADVFALPFVAEHWSI